MIFLISVDRESTGAQDEINEFIVSRETKVSSHSLVLSTQCI
jgi:hypothetical protein